jgi:hypothetical protein
MKRIVGIGILLTSVALSCLANMVSPAFAATSQVSVATHTQSNINRARVTSREFQMLPARHSPRQSNQTFVGKSYSGNTTYARGRNQGNGGNQGYNLRHYQNNEANGGNQLINQGREGGYWQHNQRFLGRSYSSDHYVYIGTNQGNTGNQGYNRGDFQDNGSNGGNQLVN